MWINKKECFKVEQNIVNCVLGGWSQWSNCLESEKYRHRQILVAPENGGTPCGPTYETQKCQTPILNCNQATTNGGYGIADYQITLTNPLGGVIYLDMNSQRVPDKLEIIHLANGSYIKKATTSMLATGNYGPFDDVYGTHPTNLVADTMSSNQFIGTSKGSIPKRITEFQTDTSIMNSPITPTFQQRIWWKYTAADYALSQNAIARVTGPQSTAWNAKRVCEPINPGDPIDCEVSLWSKYSICENDSKTRTRTIITNPENGGAACPVLIDTVYCDGSGDDFTGAYISDPMTMAEAEQGCSEELPYLVNIICSVPGEISNEDKVYEAGGASLFPGGENYYKITLNSPFNPAKIVRIDSQGEITVIKMC